MYCYKKIHVLSYDADSDMWRAQMVGKDTEEFDIPRIYIYFQNENPTNYINKIKNAFQQRIYADSLIRYNFYINNMPKHDLNHLDEPQTARIETLVKNTEKMRKEDLTPYIDAVNDDYERTMNKIIFDTHLTRND